MLSFRDNEKAMLSPLRKIFFHWKIVAYGRIVLTTLPHKNSPASSSCPIAVLIPFPLMYKMVEQPIFYLKSKNALYTLFTFNGIPGKQTDRHKKVAPHHTGQHFKQKYMYNLLK